MLCYSKTSNINPQISQALLGLTSTPRIAINAEGVVLFSRYVYLYHQEEGRDIPSAFCECFLTTTIGMLVGCSSFTIHNTVYMPKQMIKVSMFWRMHFSANNTCYCAIHQAARALFLHVIGRVSYLPPNSNNAVDQEFDKRHTS